MDRSKTVEKNPQGDEKAIQASLNIIRDMKSGMTPADQIAMLRPIVQCVNMWCSISHLGVRKMGEHVTERFGRFVAEDAQLQYNEHQLTRAILLVNYRGDHQIGMFARNATDQPTAFTGVQLFLAVSLRILAVKMYCRITDCIELAHKVEVCDTDDRFLLDLMTSKDCATGNRDLVVNALCHLCDTMHWAQDGAQERANIICQGKNALRLMIRSLKINLTLKQFPVSAIS